MLAMTIAWPMVRAPDPMEVPKLLATSLAPIPNAKTYVTTTDDQKIHANPPVIAAWSLNQAILT
jgi:hypothetical protein